ncbi:MAG: hypothetical protein H3C45_00980 [Bacteroidia bacterium]|nr:hypothetical protein [Bacteroidia bacterium]
MKQIILYIFSYFFYFIAYSQSNVLNEFVGTLQLDNKQIITYKISINPTNTGDFKGTSVSDIFGKDRTHSNIIGKFNAERNKISFTELNNISSKSKAADELFCYITVKDAKLNIRNNKAIIQGKFKGLFKNGKACANGKIFLISVQYLDSLSNFYLNNESKLSQDSIKTIKHKINTLKTLSEKTTIKANDTLRLNLESNEIIIELWDGEKEDNDEVTLYYNDNQILDRLTIKKEKKLLVIPIESNNGLIQVKAINEGVHPPCTANILIKDNTNFIPIISVLKKGESAYIKILKKTKK